MAAITSEVQWSTELQKLPIKFHDKIFQEAFFGALHSLIDAWEKVENTRTIFYTNEIIKSVCVYQYPLSKDSYIKSSQCEFLQNSISEYFKNIPEEYVNFSFNFYEFEEVANVSGSRYTVIS